MHWFIAGTSIAYAAVCRRAGIARDETTSLYLSGVQQMRNVSFGASVVAMLGLFFAAGLAIAQPPEDKAGTQSVSGSGSLKRIILLKFKAGTTPEKIDELAAGIRALKGKIPAIASLFVGANTNTQNISQGFTHIVLVTFKTAEDRAAFLSDPVHKQYETQVLVPHLQDFLVIEFTVAPKDHR